MTLQYNNYISINIFLDTFLNKLHLIKICSLLCKFFDMYLIQLFNIHYCIYSKMLSIELINKFMMRFIHICRLLDCINYNYMNTVCSYHQYFCYSLLVNSFFNKILQNYLHNYMGRLKQLSLHIIHFLINNYLHILYTMILII